MIRKSKPIEKISAIEPEVCLPEKEDFTLDAAQLLVTSMQDQSKALTDAITRAASVLAVTIAKNRPADGYLFTVQRDSQGRVTSLAAKRGRNAD